MNLNAPAEKTALQRRPVELRCAAPAVWDPNDWKDEMRLKVDNNTAVWRFVAEMKGSSGEILGLFCTFNMEQRDPWKQVVLLS